MRDATNRRLLDLTTRPDGAVFWGEALASQSKVDGVGDAADFGRSTGGFIGGVEGSVGDWLVGLSASYSRSSYDRRRSRLHRLQRQLPVRRLWRHPVRRPRTAPGRVLRPERHLDRAQRRLPGLQRAALGRVRRPDAAGPTASSTTGSTPAPWLCRRSPGWLASLARPMNSPETGGDIAALSSDGSSAGNAFTTLGAARDGADQLRRNERQRARPDRLAARADGRRQRHGPQPQHRRVVRQPGRTDRQGRVDPRGRSRLRGVATRRPSRPATPASSPTARATRASRSASTRSSDHGRTPDPPGSGVRFILGARCRRAQKPGDGGCASRLPSGRHAPP